MIMTREELYSEYLAWLGHSDPLPQAQLFSLPLINQDITEDDFSLTNRLYFAVPHFDGSQLHLFIFFEENQFLKEPNGNLSLFRSSFALETAI